MNFQDSTAKVISYWDLDEKYEYSVIYQNLEFSEKDTTSNETVTYDVEVSVIDSAENNYIVRWSYKNFKSNSSNPLVQKLAKLAKDISIEIKLDALGVIVGVVNWEEIRDYMAKSIDNLKNEQPEIPDIDNIFLQYEIMYSSKLSIEVSAIQDVQQFHNFHGGKYALNEQQTGQLSTPNVYFPDRPLDTEIFVELVELDEDNNQFTIRSIDEINSEQLTQTIYDYFSEVSKSMNQKLPKREDFQNYTSTVEIVSRIHETGWVLESVLRKEAGSEGAMNIEIRTIQMK